MKNIKSLFFISLLALWPADASNKITASTTTTCDFYTTEAELALWQQVQQRLIQNGETLNDLFLWHRFKYKLSALEWANWGYNDYSNINRPYAKAMNSAYLLRYGLKDDSGQWHGYIDYNNVGQALLSNAHYEISYKLEPTKDWLAWAYTDVEDEYTALSCLLFCATDADGDTIISNNPVTRAGDYVHEGWHHWQKYNGQPVGHETGCTDVCNYCCDYFDGHTIEDYHSSTSDFGNLHRIQPRSNGPRTFHSPNQVQVEFLCDLYNYAEDFVPASVKELAKSEANHRIDTRFFNTVPFRVGNSSPLDTE